MRLPRKQKSLDGVMRASTVLTRGEGRQYATLCAIADLYRRKGKEFVIKKRRLLANHP